MIKTPLIHGDFVIAASVKPEVRRSVLHGQVNILRVISGGECFPSTGIVPDIDPDLQCYIAEVTYQFVDIRDSKREPGIGAE